MDANNRFHSLDNLRAMLMWLGIVLHVSVNHLSKSFFPFHDKDVTPVADLILVFIHAFRMPAFFILAGFLAAMMATSRGHKAMLRNRVRRIALPFAIFYPILLVAMATLSLVFMHQMKYGTLGIVPSMLHGGHHGHAGLTTMHLWFIYYLFLLCVLAAAVCAVEQTIPEKIKNGYHAAMKALAMHWWGIALLAVPLAIVGAGYRGGFLAQNGSFIPNINEMVQNGVFFIFGWSLFRNREALLARYHRLCWSHLAAGCLAFAGALILMKAFKVNPAGIPHFELVFAFVYGVTAWLWSLALIGLFVRYLPTQNKVLRYISESSYWVYMTHMLGTIGFGALLYNASIGALGKMGVNILATTAACLLTYHLFVRNTWIGVLLNGKRHAQNMVAAAVNPA